MLLFSSSLSLLLASLQTAVTTGGKNVNFWVQHERGQFAKNKYGRLKLQATQLHKGYQPSQSEPTNTPGKESATRTNPSLGCAYQPSQ